MRLFGYLVTRNEMGRYLEECLEEWLPCLDGLLIWDDRSTDGTWDWLISDEGPQGEIAVGTRHVEQFSFLENEGCFREDAWRSMEDVLKPKEGDWIMSLDADEIIRYPYPEYLKELFEALGRNGYNGVEFHIHEVWTPLDEPPMIRTDGFWAQTEGLRACQWVPDGKFKATKMGGGSLPVNPAPNIMHSVEIDILHYGYARQVDREKKYERYRSKSGHNPRHISSILKPPTLAPLPPLGIEL